MEIMEVSFYCLLAHMFLYLPSSSSVIYPTISNLMPWYKTTKEEF
jgi:hypothetical protein